MTAHSFRRAMTLMVWLLLATAARPCGPFITSWHLVAVSRPDGDPKDWVGGRLGLIQPGFPTRDLGIIWRWLAGVGLNPEAQAALLGEATVYANGEQAWQEARLATGAPPLELRTGRMVDYASSPVIGNHALLLAAQTLKARMATFGAKSPEVASWLKAQDRVFVFDGPAVAELPEPAGPEQPLLIRQDRAYQIGAAHYYREHLLEALAAFEGVAADSANPWLGWARFMKARIYANHGSIAGSALDAQEALKVLEGLQRDPKQKALHADAAALENRIRYQEAPAEFYGTLLGNLAQPQRGAALAQDLEDLRWLRRITPWTGKAPWPEFKARGVHAWIEGLQAGQLEALMAVYDGEPTLPNLVSVMIWLRAEHPRAEEFLKAAQRSSQKLGPAYATLVTHRLRLLTTQKRHAAAGALADEALNQGLAPRWPSAWNLWSQVKLAQAKDLDGVAAHLGRRIAAVDDGYGSEGPDEDKEDRRLLKALDPTVVALLNHQLPLKAWQELLASPRFPAELRPELIEALWTRGILLEQAPVTLAHAQELARCRPALAKDLKAWLDETNPLKRRQRAFFLIWDHRLWPQVLMVRKEAFEYGTLLARWNPAPSKTPPGQSDEALSTLSFPAITTWAFLDESSRKLGEAEAQAIPAPLTWFCLEALAIAEASPEDPLAAEGLSRAVRASRNANRDGRSAALVLKAFRLLHKRYPESAAAKAAKVYH